MSEGWGLLPVYDGRDPPVMERDRWFSAVRVRLAWVNAQTCATELDDTDDSFLSTWDEKVGVGVSSCQHGGGKAVLLFFGRHFDVHRANLANSATSSSLLECPPTSTNGRI